MCTDDHISLYMQKIQSMALDFLIAYKIYV